MSIHFSTFAVEIKITFSPPETRTIGTHMRIDLNQVSTKALNEASHGLHQVAEELKEALCDDRFRDVFYIQLIALEILFGSEWMRREKAKEDLSC